MNSHDKKVIKKIGFHRDQDGIMNRFFREGERWEPHLRNTREFILESFQDSHVKTIGIMGSGWLMDLPVEELSARYDRVLLLDIRHPVEVRHRVRNMENVVLQEVDLTGGAVHYCREVKRSLNKGLKEQFKGWMKGRLKEKDPASFSEDMILEIPVLAEETDALISLNLLNQLNGILLDYLQADKYFQQAEADAFSKKIQDFHIRWITGKPGCIITDIAEHNFNRDGEEIVKSLLHTRLPEGKRRKSWTWDFDSEKTYYPDMLTKIEIQAIEWQGPPGRFNAG